MMKESKGKLGGTVTESTARGGQMVHSYGRDNSDYVGSKKMARSGSDGFGGGMDDLSHSLSGNRANQTSE
jgi:hypothetical protein